MSGRHFHFVFTVTSVCALAVAICLTTATPSDAQVRLNGHSLDATETATPKLVKASEATPFREELRKIIDGLGAYADSRDANFIMIGRNPLSLMVTSSWEQQRKALLDPDSLSHSPIPDDAPGGPMRRILNNFDVVALDNFNCAKPKPPKDAPPPTKAEQEQADFTKRLMQSIRDTGTPLIGLDACDHKQSIFTVARTGSKQSATSIAVYGTPDKPRKLPTGRLPYENSRNVEAVTLAKNGLWLRNPRVYPNKADWVVAMQNNNADVLIVNPFFTSDQPLSKQDVHSLKYKFMGARRLLIADMNVGIAHDTAYYWQREWRVGAPGFLRQPDPQSVTGILVNYWDPDWKQILGTYFKGLMDLGFDGVMFSGLEAAEFPEAATILE